MQPARLRWIAGERVFVDCDVWQNPYEVEPHNACAGNARAGNAHRTMRRNHDTEHSRRLTRGVDLKAGNFRAGIKAEHEKRSE
jgi:hypothetical protein